MTRQATEIIILICAALIFAASCTVNQARSDEPAKAAEPTTAAGAGNSAAGNSAGGAASADASSPAASGATPPKSADAPRTVRDFFNLLPEKYFKLEGCDRATDKNCDRARAEYLKTFLQTEDAANGYLKAGCDGAQSCLTMALFKRANGTYIVGVNTSFEMGDDYYFLDYAGGQWRDVSASVVPEFSKRNMYELPRYGTTVPVFAKKIIEEGPDFMASEKGAKLYDLTWTGERFVRQK